MVHLFWKHQQGSDLFISNPFLCSFGLETLRCQRSYGILRWVRPLQFRPCGDGYQQFAKRSNETRSNIEHKSSKPWRTRTKSHRKAEKYRKEQDPHQRTEIKTELTQCKLHNSDRFCMNEDRALFQNGRRYVETNWIQSNYGHQVCCTLSKAELYLWKTRTPNILNYIY